MFSGFEPATATSITARAGQFAYDTMTLRRPGDLGGRAGRGRRGADRGRPGAGGERAAYALCRPPGHHATRSCFGGSCYLNNTAAAAARLRDAPRAPVAVIDVDAHHGNGTQAIFYDDPEVLVGSVHVDPGAGWFPHFLGFALGERDAAPEPARTATCRWRPAPATRRGWRRSPSSPTGRATARRAGLVVALGVDAAAGDPRARSRSAPTGYRAAGRALGALGLPTVVVQEGGYDLESIGPLVAAALAGFESG